MDTGLNKWDDFTGGACAACLTQMGMDPLVSGVTVACVIFVFRIFGPMLVRFVMRKIKEKHPEDKAK